MENQNEVSTGKVAGSGRKKGTKNKITSVLKSSLKDIVYNELEKLPSLLEKMSDETRLSYVIKLLPYVMPKAVEEVIETSVKSVEVEKKTRKKRSSQEKYYSDAGITIGIGKNKGKFEHRVIMSEYIGRELLGKKEKVAHIDGDNNNNSLDNLFLYSGKYIKCFTRENQKENSFTIKFYGNLYYDTYQDVEKLKVDLKQLFPNEKNIDRDLKEIKNIEDFGDEIRYGNIGEALRILEDDEFVIYAPETNN